MQPFTSFDSIFDHLRASERRTVAVVFPHDSHTLEAVRAASEAGIADFILIGNEGLPEIEKLKSEFSDRIRVLSQDDPDRAARMAVELVADGQANVLMKGLINTENLLRAVLDKSLGLFKTGSVLSHVTVSQIDSLGRLLLFSDPAVIPFPTPAQHEAIVGYLAGVGNALRIQEPRIALIHCNEKISPKFPVTEAYVNIKKLAQEGKFGRAIVDGPMDVKTALDSHAGEVKGIDSPIEGRADALVFPDIEAGNVFYKTVSFFAESVNAGMLMGAEAPVVLPSRADSSRSKLCSIALACLYSLKT